MSTNATSTELEAIYVLADWDNLEGSFPGRNVGQEVAYELRERVAALGRIRFPTTREIEIRCYSGWVEPNGSPTNQGLMLRPKIEDLSGRVQGVSVRLDCVDGMVIQGAPAIFAHLAGPRDCRCPARNAIYEQKMVDTMIVADAAALSEYDEVALVVVGDDIDLTPGLVTAGLQRAFVTKRSTAKDEVVWLRRRPQTRQTRMLNGVATVEAW